MKKSNKMIGCTAKEIFESTNALASSAKLRKETEKYFKKKGMDITIDEFGIGHLYTPLYVSRPNGDTFGDFKNKKQKCPHCGKTSSIYVPTIGWECTNKKCLQKRQDKLIADVNSKSDTEKLLMANFVPLSRKNHMLLHKKNGKRIKGQEI